jgi:uncharacterized protein
VASRIYQRGSVVFVAECFASVVNEEWRQEVCHYCFKFSYSKKLKFRCNYHSVESPCTAFYCSDKCANNDSVSHDLICHGYKRLYRALRSKINVRQKLLLAAAFDPVNSGSWDFIENVEELAKLVVSEEEVTILKLIMACLSKRNVDSAGFDELLQMQNNEENYKLHFPDKYRRHKLLFQFLKYMAKIDIDDGTFRQVVFRENGNSFGIWENGMADFGNELLGYAIFPTATFFNHSCAPSLSKIQVGRQVLFHATHDILVGDELSISYGYSQSETVHERQERLWLNYYFKCDCPLCQHELALNGQSELVKL